VKIKDLFQQYIDKDLSGYETIATLTGIINPDIVVDVLAMVNQIARLESGKMDRETFISIYKLKDSE